MTPPLPDERVLSTLNDDGTRRWIHPRLAHGRFLRWRRVVGYALIALFVALPFIRIGGRPALLLDLLTRELSLFGAVFRPSDGFLLMLLGLSIVHRRVPRHRAVRAGVVRLGLSTDRVSRARVSPDRALARGLAGAAAQARCFARASPSGASLKWVIYAVLSFVLANVFLAYFVGVDRLALWVLRLAGRSTSAASRS